MDNKFSDIVDMATSDESFRLSSSTPGSGTASSGAPARDAASVRLVAAAARLGAFSARVLEGASDMSSDTYDAQEGFSTSSAGESSGGVPRRWRRRGRGPVAAASTDAVLLPVAGNHQPV